MGVKRILLSRFSLVGATVRRILRPREVFVRAPLFFYVLHLSFHAGLALLLAPGGTSLVVMYVFWLLGLVILYPLCLWYGRFKHCQPAKSLLRFF